jgi:hypothetical protein
MADRVAAELERHFQRSHYQGAQEAALVERAVAASGTVSGTELSETHGN